VPQHIDDLMKNFDPLVESKFREFLYTFLQKYYHNATREKLTHIIMNLPLGYFLNEDDINHLFQKNKSLSYKELINLLKEHNLKQITEGDECHTNGSNQS